MGISRLGYDGGMAVQVEWQDEQGRTIAVYDGPLLDWQVLNFFPGGASCLSAIDPYGDTVFNQIQIPRLAVELDALLPPGGKRTPPAAINALRQFVQSCIGKTHTYLKFIGD